MSNQDAGTGQTRPFADVLRELGRGVVHNDLSAGLQEITNAVREHGGKGTLRLDIEVKPLKGSPALSVSGKVTAKPPQGEAATSVFFTDSAGNLRRDDPNQPQLPLRGVPNDTPRSAQA